LHREFPLIQVVPFQARRAGARLVVAICRTSLELKSASTAQTNEILVREFWVAAGTSDSRAIDVLCAELVRTFDQSLKSELRNAMKTVAINAREINYFRAGILELLKLVADAELAGIWMAQLTNFLENAIEKGPGSPPFVLLRNAILTGKTALDILSRLGTVWTGLHVSAATMERVVGALQETGLEDDLTAAVTLTQWISNHS
jgi:hypothetical protein